MPAIEPGTTCGTSRCWYHWAICAAFEFKRKPILYTFNSGIWVIMIKIKPVYGAASAIYMHAKNYTRMRRCSSLRTVRLTALAETNTYVRSAYSHVCIQWTCGLISYVRTHTYLIICFIRIMLRHITKTTGAAQHQSFRRPTLHFVPSMTHTIRGTMLCALMHAEWTNCCLIFTQPRNSALSSKILFGRRIKIRSFAFEWCEINKILFVHICHSRQWDNYIQCDIWAEWKTKRMPLHIIVALKNNIITFLRFL